MILHKHASIDVCRKFILNVFGVGKKRIDTVKKKIISGRMGDDGGYHRHHVVKLTEDIKTFIQEHCRSIPHAPSHYSRENTNLNYFHDKSLTLHKLYLSFTDFYIAVCCVCV